MLYLNGNSATYDAENRLTALTATGGASETILYDAVGQRVQKSYGGSSTVYVYDAFGRLAAEYANGTTWSRDYIFDGTGFVVASENASGLCTTCYFGYDHLGSVRIVMDQHGSVIGRHDFLPFGEELLGTAGRTTDGFNVTNDVTQKFTGQIRDQESGEDFFNARYFTAGLGRFNSADPGNAGASLGSSQSWNGYGYVLGNPLGRTDVSGRTSCTASNRYCGIAGAVGLTHPPYGSSGVLHDGWNSIYDGLTLLNLFGSSGLTKSGEGGTAVVSYGSGGSDSFDWANTLSASYLAALNMQTASMAADYLQLSITIGPSVGPFNLFSGGVSATLSRTGSWFIGPVLSVGPSAGLPVGPAAINGSFVAGWLNQSSPPSGGELTSWLDGWSVGVGGGNLFGAGFQMSNGNSGWENSVEGGLYTPQAGVNGGYNFCFSQCHP